MAIAMASSTPAQLRRRYRQHTRDQLYDESGCAQLGWAIYTLSDPRDLREVRYVGQTNAPRRRFLQHLNHAQLWLPTPPLSQGSDKGLDGAWTRVREASRSHALLREYDSPSPRECRDARIARSDAEYYQQPKLRPLYTWIRMLYRDGNRLPVMVISAWLPSSVQARTAERAYIFDGLARQRPLLNFESEILGEQIALL
jgi:hypothetical protein